MRYQIQRSSNAQPRWTEVHTFVDADVAKAADLLEALQQRHCNMPGEAYRMKVLRDVEIAR